MKIRLLALLLAALLLLTACANGPAEVTDPEPEQASVTEAQPNPTEEEEEDLDYFGILYPEDGTIPRGKDLTEYVQQLADNTSRISQINYTVFTAV